MFQDEAYIDNLRYWNKKINIHKWSSLAWILNLGENGMCMCLYVCVYNLIKIYYHLIFKF